MENAHLQQYRFIKKYKGLVRNEWLRTPRWSKTSLPPVIRGVGMPQHGDIVVHMRWGDPENPLGCTAGE